MQRLVALVFGGLLVLAVGCTRSEELSWVSSEQVLALDPKLRAEVQELLVRHCGTATAPKMLGREFMDPQALRHGAQVYQRHCAGCHGTTGDGAGPAADTLYPRPRDYRAGVFKFTSTPYGAKPRREDLLRVVRQGAKGTSMPAFHLLPAADIEALVDHVLLLTYRGELEFFLADEAEGAGQLDPEVVRSLIHDVILPPWEEARNNIVMPVTPMPAYSEETVRKGREAFLTETAGCYKCHGEDGRGRTAENVGTDRWGFKTRAADLSAGMFHGGNRPIDLYRRIYAGINGTPMPSFESKLADQPETIWHLVHYVYYISGARRRAVMGEPDSWLPAAAGPAATASSE